MKHLMYKFALLLCVLLTSCKSTKYVEVPVPTTKIEYRDRVSVDTIMKIDSIITNIKGDTVILEKYKYIYRVREVKDTVNITDTVTNIVHVETVKEVNKLHNWQILLMILGGILIGVCGFKLFRFIKR